MATCIHLLGPAHAMAPSRVNPYVLGNMGFPANSQVIPEIGPTVVVEEDKNGTS